MASEELSFGEAFEMFEGGLISSTELIMAAATDSERVQAATAIANRHSVRAGGFPSAANCLTSALTRVTDPIQIAKLRVNLAWLYNNNGHRDYAATMVERGFEALAGLVDGASTNVHHELTVLREALAGA